MPAMTDFVRSDSPPSSLSGSSTSSVGRATTIIADFGILSKNSPLESEIIVEILYADLIIISHHCLPEGN